MFEYEKCIQEVKEAGIEFTEAEKTYIRCARINGINLIDSLYEKTVLFAVTVSLLREEGEAHR